MVQKEVAERVIAPIGERSILANAVELFGDASIVRTVTKDAFYPVPRVESAILKVQTKETPASADPAALLRLIRIGFSAKRKQLHNTLSVGLSLSSDQAKELLTSIGVSPTIRSQELSLQQWEALRLALKLLPTQK
jgi:16S rRNA (adenine1518-N6/adenine1519-N6)-dimethyltransferase